MGVTKIAICLPANMGVKPKTLQSLLEMVAFKPYNYVILVTNEGFNTAENRNLMAAQAIKAECTHALFVDADMIYEEDTLERLVLHNRDIVGAKYAIRHEVKEGSNEVVEYLLNSKLEGKSDDFIKEYAEANGYDDTDSVKYLTSKDNPFMVKALGGGCLLIKTEVFKKVPQPHFWYKINDGGMVTMSNDWWFCEKARESGYQIWCDPTIKPIHIGKYEH